MLDVLLVTDDMLFNSITVRLANMTAEAFLSPLYALFKSSLSVVIPCDEK
jgi:cadherin EGF LAG seven-pass G-type receptor 1